MDARSSSRCLRSQLLSTWYLYGSGLMSGATSAAKAELTSLVAVDADMSCLLIRILAWKSPRPLEKRFLFPFFRSAASQRGGAIPLAGAGRACLRPRGVARTRSRHSFL